MFKVDFRDGKAVEWSRTRDGVSKKCKDEYRPRFYVESSTPLEVREKAASLETVKATCFEYKKTSLKDDERKRVLRVDTEPQGLKEALYGLKNRFDRFRLRFYDADFQPQHRYCLQENRCPAPQEPLKRLELGMHRKHLETADLSNLVIEGREYSRHRNAVEELEAVLETRKPDILMVNRGELLDKASNFVELGRGGKLEKLASGNTVSSYGKTVDKPSRYNVPGRIVIDKSNSFLLEDAGIDGMWDLVRRSRKPLQEVAWASIGNVLTSIEVRKAMKEDLLTPWKNWEGEEPKKASVMHAADRGGFIFSPEPGIYRNVHECDFSSMYPNIMIEKNISPETVCCRCCDNSRVPELGFSICDDTGFIPEVLWKLVADRQRWKHMLEDSNSDSELLERKIDAVKWLLVSCFGYMGHAHASYGAIKCHQAINAYAREMLRDAKELFEKSGWRVEHGIIDSIWVDARENPRDIGDVCREVTRETGIELEHERRFDWCAFVPRSDSACIGSLNRYFGVSDGKVVAAGIETEQKSTPGFVKRKQEKMIEDLDRCMNPEDVLDVVREGSRELRDLAVDTSDLVIRKSVSKNLEGYSVENRSTAAIRRARMNGYDVRPGQSVSYVVRDDSAVPVDRVRLDFEADTYDPEFYSGLLVRAAESILSPLGWDCEDITSRLAPDHSSSVTDYM